MQSAADLASNFLNSVGQELQGSSETQSYGLDAPDMHDGNGNYHRDDRYQNNSSRAGGSGTGEEPSGYYKDEGFSFREEADYQRNNDSYHRSDSRRRHGSRDRFRERSRERDNRRRRDRSRERRDRSRERHHRSRGREDRDYRRARNFSPPRRSRRSRSSSTRRRDEVVVPIHKRERKLNNWDMAPPGMEGMSAEQVKQTGLFPLPGQVVGTRTPQSFAPPSEHAMMSDGSRVRVTQGAAGPVALNATLARQARRLYVGQIPFEIDEQGMADFFNSTMQNLATEEGDPVVSVQINHDKNYAFVEFQTPEQATAAMGYDGITFQTQTLKIRRPKDYHPPGGPDYNNNTQPQPHHQHHHHNADSSMGQTTAVPDTPNKIFIGGLPVYLNEEQVVELLKSFGELRAFNLVKDPTTNQSKGFAFCEYADPNVTDLACQGLNNMELGEKRLVVQRASVGAKQGDMHTSGGNNNNNNNNTGGTSGNMSLPFVPSTVTDEEATRVLQLMNMVTPDELEDDEEYQDIWEDIAEECSKFGKMLDMKIPRPQNGQNVPGLGKIFVRYETKEEALVGLRALAGRKFADRTVVTSFVDEDDYLNDAF
ncbi:hypothetical protein INT45_013695 [Circinella minor]|uniref:Splicing factor U2AF subunit n=1 Tax=Circinella minor TaxID=1195481 RepID=A0A8H7S8F7_9FUNG|nr:hypothetical protein INT45_013695 [Circinella minor]